MNSPNGSPNSSHFVGYHVSVDSSGFNSNYLLVGLKEIELVLHHSIAREFLYKKCFDSDPICSRV